MACVTQSLLHLQCFLYLTLISLLLPTPLGASTFLTSLPNCPDKCGNITIPYPFGTLPGCYREGFNLMCNDSTTPPKLILGPNIEVLDINITTSEARVLNYIGYDCYKNRTNDVHNKSSPTIGIKGLKPFLFSNRRNKFTVIGCYAQALISADQANSHNYFSGCYSFCDSLNSTTGDGGSCNGLGCCQTSIPQGLNYYKVQWSSGPNDAWSFNPCNYAMLVQEDWYNFSVQDLRGFGFYERNMKMVPIVLDWAIRENVTCLGAHVESSVRSACQSKYSRCDNSSNGEGYICKCLEGYDGNPYIPNGCTDIDECQFLDKYPCHGNCTNIEGSYECSCREGTNGNATIGNCTKDPQKFPYPARVAISIEITKFGTSRKFFPRDLKVYKMSNSPHENETMEEMTARVSGNFFGPTLPYGPYPPNYHDGSSSQMPPPNYPQNYPQNYQRRDQMLDLNYQQPPQMSPPQPYPYCTSNLRCATKMKKDLT